MNIVLSIPVASPFAWSQVLRYLSMRCTPGVETVAGGRYTRQTAAGPVSVHYDTHALMCSGEGLSDRSDCLRRIERLFDTRRDPKEVELVLRRSVLLRPRMRKLAGLRVPGCWEPFELCVRVILGQQVSVPAAHTLMTRLTARCPGLQAGQVAGADLSGLGLTGRRVRTIRVLAERTAEGSIRFETQSWAEISGRLQEIPGFGPWTVNYLALRLGRDADAFPETDLGLLRAAGVERPRDLLRMAEEWRPYRGYAAMYLWA